MRSFFFRKLVSTFATMVVIILATFCMMKMIPGDPFTDEKALPKEIHNQLKRHYGLEQSWRTQLKTYTFSLLKGDFGLSFKYPGTAVNQIIGQCFATSALLGLEALFLALGCGLLFGTISALYQNRWQDGALIALASLGLSVPSFIFASLLQWVFAFKLHLLPFARWGTFAHTLLPAIALAAHPTAFLTRLIRANLINVLSQDFIFTAKAKGLTFRKILLKHALPQALLPLLPYLAPMVANILIGSFIIETLFAIPGLGQWVVKSVLNRDYTFIMGITVFYSFLLLGFSVLMDFCYTLLDPRQR
jgi:oligopeptide transport system permease protein